MSTDSPGEDSGGEPAPAQDPWARPADFGQPGPAVAPSAEPAQPAPSASAAQPAQPPSEPASFVSPAPASWSAPAEWTPPAPPTAAQPTQSAQPAWPAPPPRLAPDDSSMSQPPGNGFSPAGADPWPAQPPADFSASPLGAPTADQYGYPPAGQVGYRPYDASAVTRTSRVAIAALVCGVAQFFLGLFALNFLLAIPAIICGAIGMRQTRERGQGGRGLSIAGLVLGILGIVWNVLYVVLVIALTNVSSRSGS